MPSSFYQRNTSVAAASHFSPAQKRTTYMQHIDTTFPVAVTANASVIRPNHPEAVVTQTLTDLVSARQEWQNGAYQASTAQLYDLLQRCYRLYNDMSADTEIARSLRAALKSCLQDQGIKVADSAHTLAKIVRCVFGNDRRRVSVYAIALTAALAEKVKVDDLPTYFRQRGGVEEVRRARAANVLTARQKAEKATDWLDDKELAVVHSETISQMLDSGKVGMQHVLLVTQQADGSLIANAFISNDGVVNAAKAAFYSAEKSSREQSEANAAPTTQEAKIASAVEAIIASVEVEGSTVSYVSHQG